MYIGCNVDVYGVIYEDSMYEYLGPLHVEGILVNTQYSCILSSE